MAEVIILLVLLGRNMVSSSEEHEDESELFHSRWPGRLDVVVTFHCLQGRWHGEQLYAASNSMPTFYHLIPLRYHKHQHPSQKMCFGFRSTNYRMFLKDLYSYQGTRWSFLQGLGLHTQKHSLSVISWSINPSFVVYLYSSSLLPTTRAEVIIFLVLLGRNMLSCSTAGDLAGWMWWSPSTGCRGRWTGAWTTAWASHSSSGGLYVKKGIRNIALHVL